MNILNPSHTAHTLKIIPRYYPEGDMSMELVNEENGKVVTMMITPHISNGYMHLQFEKTFENNSYWQVKLTTENEVAYRGKIFVTGQVADTQNYKITKDIFIL